MARLLIVDDDPAWLRLLQECLAAEGYDVDIAFDGDAALAVLKMRPPQALVIDQHMPGLSGVEVIARIRTLDTLASLPVILLTGESNGNAALPLRNERTVVIEKPVDLETLSTSLRKLLA